MRGAEASRSANLDHVVVNARFDGDAAKAIFSRLRFLLTPRGYHSLGSINHLMIFEKDYLELAGLLLGAAPLREDLARTATGLNGPVFRTENTDEAFSEVSAKGIAMLPPQSFSRPVMIEAREDLAQFRTVRVAPEVCATGRVYFCEHRTPELV